MPDSSYTALVLVIDRSGSMATIAQATEGALKEFLEKQKTLPGRLTIDTVFFDDEREERQSLVDPKTHAVDLTIAPRGMTALYDAVGFKIDSFGAKLAAMREEERPGQVLFVIATDGFENASQEITQEGVAARIKKQQEEYSWHFTFIGANQDAVLTAKQLNIAEEHAITFAADAAGTESVVASLGNYTTSVRAGAPAAYSAADRRSALGGDSDGVSN